MEGRVASIALGASYRVNDQWKFRFGMAFDQTPVDEPTPRRGCRTRTAGGWPIGGEYKWTPNFKFDAGFVYIFADSPKFNQNAGQHRDQWL